MFWLTGATFAMKVIAIITQVLLAMLLDEQAFGAAALAYTVALFGSAIANAGVSDVLIQRERNVHLWINPGFWMSMGTGVLAGLFTMAAAPVAAKLYGEPQLNSLLAVVSLGIFIHNLSAVPIATLRIQMRFRATAVLAILGHFLVSLLTVTFAWSGAGAYSFFWPIVIQGIVLGVIRWLITRPRIRWRPQFRRWKLMLSDTLSLFTVRVVTEFLGRADSVVLGMLHSTATVGVYYFGLNVSAQVARLAMGNMAGVLYPTLIKLADEPARQVEGTLRVARMLVALLTPVFILQALLADPLQRMVLGEKWRDAVPVLQVLSVGLALTSAGWTTEPFLRSRGRFNYYLRFTLWLTPPYVVALAAGAYLGGATGTAIGTVVAWCLQRVLGFVLAMRTEGVKMRRLLAIHSAPYTSALVATMVALVTIHVLSPAPLLHVLLVPLLLLAVYATILHWWDPDLTAELTTRFSSLCGRRKAASTESRTEQ